ncbi:HD domain-containing protein [Aspergillus sp. HF37]|nr:HD domain-containing protein [Aspergillus sp. HF37]
MPPQTATQKADTLISALEQYGQGDYIGEPISQLEHCLQAAHQARNNDANPDLIIAALLHDVGQIIPVSKTEDVRMDLSSSSSESPGTAAGGGGNVGRVGHESIGAAYLRGLGFSEEVCALVASHVPAKRFLSAIDNAYYDDLSSASKKSLAFQGGPFQGEELEAFMRHPLRDQMVALRRWDDAAKIEGIRDKTPPAGSYRDLIVAHLERQAC